MFGDLDLQDGYCRTLATVFNGQVISIDYRLAPEYSFKDSVDDVHAVVSDPKWGGPNLVCGDSAGGGLAIAACSVLGPDVDGLLLTNPNLDLTLDSFEHDASGWPDFEISEFAFDSWTRRMPDGCGRKLTSRTWRYPPIFVACGSDDALLPEVRALARECQAAGTSCEFMELEGAGHGVMSNPKIAIQVLKRAAGFFGSHGAAVT